MVVMMLLRAGSDGYPICLCGIGTLGVKQVWTHDQSVEVEIHIIVSHIKSRKVLLALDEHVVRVGHDIGVVPSNVIKIWNAWLLRDIPITLPGLTCLSQLL